MSKLVYNETTSEWVDSDCLIRGIVYIDENSYEFGYFESNDDYRVVQVSDGGTYYILKRNCKIPIYFNRANGSYSTVEPDNEMVFAHGGFPYTFDRYYSTRYLEDHFQEKFSVLDKVDYKYLNELPYTFGFEFETSAGYIPEDDLYTSGLIPLRDGSITGLEYSTIVLQGNHGINALRKQLEILNEYTIFDKECSLHIHYGGFKLSPQVLLRLNNLFALSDISFYCVPWAFHTNRYKNNGKDYCKLNKTYPDFNTMYRNLVGKNFFGDLHQPHPADVSGDRKWNINTRYTALNFINAICYNNAKTVEFRMLRPTYNFNKILIWLFVLGAFIKYAENLTIKAINNISTERVIKTVYSPELAAILIRALKLQKEVVQTQSLVNDFCGLRVDIEDRILTYKNLSKGTIFFY